MSKSLDLARINSLDIESILVDWIKNHRASEDFALLAHKSIRLSALDEAKDYFRKAAELEQIAVSLIDCSKTRTWGILAVSAVSLWYKANDFDQARSLAEKYLSKSLIDGPSKVQLIDLLFTIKNELDIKKRMCHSKETLK